MDLNLKVEDPALRRKKSLTSVVQFFDGKPLPSIIEISESGTCNRSCSFCPRSDPEFFDEKKFIDEGMIKKLAEELAAVEYAGMVLFSGFVEPLLDKNISRWVGIIKKKVPKSRVEIITNGDPITQKNLNKLHKAGLDALLVSCYDGAHQIEELNCLVLSSEMPLEKVVFRNRWGTEEENFGISLSNRGGLMKSAEFVIGDISKPISQPCYYPAYTFFLDYTGDVLMCGHDWGKKAIAGDFKRQSFLEIWNGPRFSKWRHELINGLRSGSPCDVCNVQGVRMGKDHADAWLDKALAECS